MTARGQFQITMLERLAGPLLAAIAAAPDNGDTVPRAALMAQLLNRAVQLGIGLGQGVELGEVEAEAGRVALTAIAASIVADHVRRTGKSPGEAELRALLPAAQAVLVFADAFAPGAPPADVLNAPVANEITSEAQALLLYLQALAPVIAAVAEFSFGRQDRKLAQDVAEKLTARARAMGAALFPPDADQAANLGLLKALGLIYAARHRAETQRLLTMDDAARASLTDTGGMVSLDPLWAQVEAEAAMLETLGQAFLSSGSEQEDNRPAPPAALEQAPAPVQKPANPMGFFKPGAKPAAIENGDGV